MNTLMLLAVGAGGFLGAISRFFLSTGVQRFTGVAFPYGTLAVNVVGSFLIGFLFLYFEHTISPNQKALLITGFLGALTTFSTFSLETVLMLQNQLYMKALANVSLNAILCVSATMIGMMVFRRVYGV